MTVASQNELIRTAKALQPGMQGDASEQSRYLTFLANDTLYGVDLDHVKEIIEYGALTQVPLAPAFVRGVFNLRGSVLPVIDLAVRLGKTPQPPSKRSCFILVELEDEGETLECGIYVDAVDEVAQIPASVIEPPPSFGVDIRSDFIAGMGKRNDQFVILLDVDRIGNVEELANSMKLGDGNDLAEERGNV